MQRTSAAALLILRSVASATLRVITGATRHRGRLLAWLGIALLIVGTAAIALTRGDRTATPPAPASGPNSSSPPVARTGSHRAAGEPGARPQPDAPGTGWRPRLSPKAPWLAAPPNPVLVSVTIDETRRSEGRISPTGGDVFLTTGDGIDARFEVRPETLPRSREFSMAPVTGITGLPFAGGLLAAVAVTPDHETFRRSAKLVFETRQPIAAEQMIVGFAVRSGKELHLSISNRIGDPKRRVTRIEMPIARPGIYGIANASSREIAAVAGHVPTEYMARLSQLVALAFPPVPSASATSRWNILPVAYAQGSSDPLPGWLLELFDAIRASFEQVIGPAFTQIPEEDCTPGPTAIVFEMFYEWAHMIRMLNPIELKDYQDLKAWAEDTKKRIDYLHALGYTDEQIAQIDAAMDSFRQQQMAEMIRKGDPLVADANRRLFARMYRCCTKETPQEYHVSTMVEASRMAQLGGYGPLDPEEMLKIQDCSCRTASVQQGAPESWTGTITHTENYNGRREQTLGRTRTTLNTRNVRFKEVITLERLFTSNEMASSYNVNADQEDYDELYDHKECGRIGGWTRGKANGSDDGVTIVTIYPVSNQPGKYHVAYSVAGADAIDKWKKYWTAKGCQIFNHTRESQGRKPVTIISYAPDTQFDDEVDPSRPFELKGTTDFEAPDETGFPQPHKSTATWDLRRCGK